MKNNTLLIGGLVAVVAVGGLVAFHKPIAEALGGSQTVDLTKGEQYVSVLGATPVQGPTSINVAAPKFTKEQANAQIFSSLFGALGQFGGAVGGNLFKPAGSKGTRRARAMQALRGSGNRAHALGAY